MDKEIVGLICLAALGISTIVGIVWTKTPGWGKYSASTLILAIALFVAAILSLLGTLEGSWFLNILFAVVGYAGGLITSRKGE